MLRRGGRRYRLAVMMMTVLVMVGVGVRGVFRLSTATGMFLCIAPVLFMRVLLVLVLPAAAVT
jgi:hypothetical protein